MSNTNTSLIPATTTDMMTVAIGTIERRVDVGLKGRQRVAWCECPECGKQRWVGIQFAPLNPPCQRCNAVKRASNVDLNSFVHKPECKCRRCRIGKGYFKGKNNPSWNGGRSVRNDGYIAVHIEDSDPMFPMAWKGKDRYGYVLEHRLTMARHIGRPLATNETVHHRNGIKSDNRIQNLELWIGNHHPGQRVSDLTCPHCGKSLINHDNE